MDRSSIMRFDDLLALWQHQGAQRSILEFLGIRSRGDIRGVEEGDPAILQVLRERLDGTWWEVTWSRLPGLHESSGGIRCRYLADSIKDAVRRCPKAQLPLQTSIDDADDAMAEDELDVLPKRQR